LGWFLNIVYRFKFDNAIGCVTNSYSDVMFDDVLDLGVKEWPQYSY